MDTHVDVAEELNRIKLAKQSLKVDDFCYSDSMDLASFYKEVFSYEFKDEPRYDYLRTLLLEQWNKNITPSKG